MCLGLMVNLGEKMNKETLKEYKSYLFKNWLLDVIIRTIKTGAETAAGMITVGAVWSGVDWIHVLSVTAVSMVYTVLINISRLSVSFSGLPDAKEEEENEKDMG